MEANEDEGEEGERDKTNQRLAQRLLNTQLASNNQPISTNEAISSDQSNPANSDQTKHVGSPPPPSDFFQLMQKQESIRIFGILGHVDHGRSTLTERLFEIAHFPIANPPERVDENRIPRSFAAPLYFRCKIESNSNQPEDAEFLLHLVRNTSYDTNGLMQWLTVVDGVILVMDFLEGLCVQAEDQLRRMMMHQIVPCLFLNKLDRNFWELRLEDEDFYQLLVKDIENFNVVTATYGSDGNDGRVSTEIGTVTFGSALQGWGFSLRTFAKLYATKFQISEEKLVKRFWGDHYFDPKDKKWIGERGKGEKTLQRGFCKFIVGPIRQIYEAVLDGDKIRLEKIFKTCKITCTAEELQQEPKVLIKTILKKWLPISDCVLEMACKHFPAPPVAQKYRCELLYTGPMDDETANAIRRCDPTGPLVVYISQMLPSSDGRFYAVGRIFSGTISNELSVHIMGIDYHPAQMNSFAAKISNMAVPAGHNYISVESLPCGNLCALSKLDKYIAKSATIASPASQFPFRDQRITSNLVAVTVDVKDPKDLPKLIQGLQYLQRVDTLVHTKVNENGEHVVESPGELHLNIMLQELQNFMKPIEIVIHKPLVVFYETVIAESDRVCCSKSPNKHNRIYVIAKPLHSDLVKEIEIKGSIAFHDSKFRSQHLVNKYGWDSLEAQKLWAFGPDTSGTNVIVDCTSGVAKILEVKDSILAGFHWATKEGILIENQMRGVQFNLLDIVLHSDAVHRGGGQIIPTARRVLYAAVLTAQPRLMEPIFLVEISTVSSGLNGVYSVLKKRRGFIFEETQRLGSPIWYIKAYMPVLESFGFVEELRSATSGQAFPNCIIDHYDLMEDHNESELTRNVIQDVRKRKGLRPEIPPLGNFLDQL